MLAGLLVAAAGQSLVLASVFRPGSFRAEPSPSERRSRVYAAAAPLIVVVMFAYLWASRGMS